MKARYLLDTNICIYLMKRASATAAARLAECYVGEVAISAITLAELEFGVAVSGEREAHNRAALDALLQDLAVVPFESTAARAYGPVRVQGRHRTRDALDKLIAAHAIALDAILVTNNEADFQAYPTLRLESWAH